MSLRSTSNGSSVFPTGLISRKSELNGGLSSSADKTGLSAPLFAMRLHTEGVSLLCGWWDCFASRVSLKKSKPFGCGYASDTCRHHALDVLAHDAISC